MNSTGDWVNGIGRDAGQVGQQVAADRGIGLERAFIKLGRGKIHDRLVHAVLHRQLPRDGRAMSAMSRSKRLMSKPCLAAFGLTTVGGNWQWSPERTTRSQRRQRYPAARLGALASLVDDAQVETPRAEQLAIQTGGGGAEHAGRVEDALDGLHFQTPGVGQQRLGVVPQLPPPPGGGAARV